MFIATILQKPGGAANETIYNSSMGTTLDEALRAAEKMAVACRKAAPSTNYRVVGGKMTHAVKPPEDKIEIVEL